jgi:hypothetical protein
MKTITIESLKEKQKRLKRWRRNNMALTFQEVCERLEDIDEITLLEVLDISSKDIIEKFQDKIEDNLEDLEADLILDKEGYDFYGDNIT